MLNPFILIILGFPIKVGTVLFISSALSTPGLEQDMVTTRVGFVLSSNVRMRDISYQGGCLNWLLVATSMVGWLIHVFWGWNPAICFSDCIWYASIRNMKKVTILYQICVHELLMSIYDVQAMSYWCPNDTQVLTPSGPLTMGLSVVVGPLKQRAVLKTTAASPVWTMEDQKPASSWEGVHMSPKKSTHHTKHVYVFFLNVLWPWLWCNVM